jgi:hypothetical protein
MAKAKAGTTFAGEKPEAWLKAARHVGKQRGGYLAGSERTYGAAVEAVATILRPRFESGELVPWGPNDDRWEETTPPRTPRAWAAIPNNRIAEACRELFITAPTAAFVVLTWGSRPALRAAEWFDVFEEDCRPPLAGLRTVAGEVMGHDVSGFARRKGWLRATRRAA